MSQPVLQNARHRSGHGCDVCGKFAEFQFRNKSSDNALRKWQFLCPKHANEYLLNLPENQPMESS